jgi:hypothetical protein
MWKHLSVQIYTSSDCTEWQQSCHNRKSLVDGPRCNCWFFSMIVVAKSGSIFKIMRISKMSSTCTYRYIMSKHVSYFSWTCKLLQLFMKFSKWLSAKLTIQYSSDWITVTWWIHVIKRVRINIGAEKGRTVETTQCYLYTWEQLFKSQLV